MKKLILILTLFLFTKCAKETIEPSTENVELKTTLIVSPRYPAEVACDEIDFHAGYPDQDAKQYLHPQEVIDCGLEHLVVFDHITTRKMGLVFKVEDLCNIDLYIQNIDPLSPFYLQALRFRDIYNWTDERGNPLFNLNHEIYKAWGITKGNQTFTLKSLNTITKEDMSFDHTSVTLDLRGTDTISYYF